MFLKKSGFTLLEIMMVITVIGILISAFAPQYRTYMSRWRDTARITDIDQLLKAHSSYFTDYDKYPDHVQGCVNQTAILKYTGDQMVKDPLSRSGNVCTDPIWYGYASGNIAFNPNVYTLLAVMEQPKWGNYNSTLLDLTGTLTATSYNNAVNLTSKWTWAYYVRTP
jgi:prepilin-type N-terminal cleavage/methylation domain-containing protein